MVANLTLLVLKGAKVQGVNGLPSAVGLERRSGQVNVCLLEVTTVGQASIDEKDLPSSEREREFLE